MGGLRKYMPVTHITFLIACLAISGIPPFSGFFSKDEILSACFQYSTFAGIIMTVVAAMTAFYMFRVYYGIFWGTENKKLHAEHTPHEAPLCMTAPLVVLTLITLVAGFIPFGHFVSASGQSYDIHLDWTVAGTSIAIAIVSILLATYIYRGERQPVAEALKRSFPRLHRAAYKRFYQDEIWQYVTHRIIFRWISRPLAWIDRHIVDGLLNGIAAVTNLAGESLRPLQDGDIRTYAIWLLTGCVGLTLLLVYLI